MRRLIATTILLSACALAVAPPAAACGACTCDDQPRGIVNLIRSAPLNLQIPLRVLDDGEAPPWIERASDSAMVPATVEKLESPAGVWWLAVDEQLAPNTDYRIVRSSGVDSAFTTSSAPDHDPPVLASLSARGGGNGALCATSLGGILTPVGASDGDTFDVWLELEILVGNTVHVVYAEYSRSSQELPLGSSAEGNCFGSLELPPPPSNAPLGYAIGARLRDAAGNASALVTTTFIAEASEPAGCGTGEPNPMVPTAGAGMGGGAPVDPRNAGASGDPSDPERTSKGCGCAIPAEPGGAGSLVGLLLLPLLARRRTPK